MQWYEDEVRSLERRVVCVNGNRPPVFYGSSSIRLWETLAEDVGPSVLNLGFGGSTMEACQHFFLRVVPPAHPRSLLIYAGDNDLGDGRTAEQVLGWFRGLADRVAATLGPIPLGFISIKPSPARMGIVDRIRSANEAIRKDIEGRAQAYYVDVFTEMLGRADLFVSDGLHMNREGYRMWGRLLEPYRNRIFTE